MLWIQHTSFLGLHSKRAIRLLTIGWFFIEPLDKTAFFDFVNGIFAIGFTGQVKKIWQRHIFFIFDGSKRMDSRFGSETSGWGRVSTMFKPRTN